MGLVNDIIEHDSLTEREQSIRTYLIQQPENLYNMSARDLGEATYSSAAAITRFCKKLGCKGYQDFRIRFLEDVRETRKALNNNEDVSRIPGNVGHISLMLKKADEYHKAVEKTLQENPFDCMRRAATMIHEAVYLDFYAFNLCALMSNYAAYQFMQCGKAAVLFSENSMQIRNAAEKRPGHLAIIVSYTGANADLIDLAKILRKNGTRILCFTGNTEGKLVKLSDQVLVLPTGEKDAGCRKGERDLMFTTSFKYLVDVLFSAEYDTERERLEKKDAVYFKKESDNM